MGCKTKYSSGGNDPCFRTNHCSVNVPLPVNQATTVEFREHPLADFRDSSINYQIDRRDSIAIMHPSIALPAVSGGGSPPAATVGSDRAWGLRRLQGGARVRRPHSVGHRCPLSRRVG